MADSLGFCKPDLLPRDASRHYPPHEKRAECVEWRRAATKPPETQPLAERDWSIVEHLVRAYVEGRRGNGQRFKDVNYYIAEKAIEAVYGKDIWTELRALPEW